MHDLVKQLLEAREGRDHWTGRLSESALSTAVAVFALGQIDSAAYSQQIRSGLGWLISNVNADGGWGDTDRSFSNISTTLLCWCVLKNVDSGDKRQEQVIAHCQSWIAKYCGSLDAGDIAEAVYARYDNDRTFSAPIMTVCALSGVLGEGRGGWKHVARLPFELSIFPQSLYGRLGLPVVSYALPALIAIGQVGHYFNPTRNPLLRLARRLALKPALKRLQQIQPVNGGFLEAAPLTGFVAGSLAALGQKGHPVVQKGAKFLLESQRSDGSWPIDTDLAVWLTTLSVNALAEGNNLDNIPLTEKNQLANWLLGCQYETIHPYTGSAPGGWGWSDKPGAVPDADDTAGAILALVNLGKAGCSPQVDAIIAGCRWLLGVQNKDGGIPTFCRGWGKLPFDRSSSDITAHALAAWAAALELINDARLTADINTAMQRALEYLKARQHFDGWWRPLWFGCQYMPDDSNEVYGTSRVMVALATMPEEYAWLTKPMLEKSSQWLVSVQAPSGGFSGGISEMIVNAESDLGSIEETALAILALRKALERLPNEKQKKTDKLSMTIATGEQYLAARWQSTPLGNAAPIGFYFAKLWYYEQLYPLIFSVGAGMKNK